MMARRALFAALAGACWLSWALPSRADEPEETRAEALFREGKAALAANDLKAACAKLEESERLEAAAGTLLNWADCEERSEHLAKALSLYEKARRMLPDDDFRIGFTDGRIQGLARRVPTLELVLRAAAPPDARVTLDGAPAPVGNAEPTDPGRHVAIVHAAGRADERFDVTLVEGDRRVVEIGPGAPVTTLVAASQPSAGGARTAGWILLGAGGVALAAGVVTGIMTACAIRRASTPRPPAASCRS